MYLTLETLAGGPQICYYHYDGLGSVTDLSNSSGQHIEHYYYDPFGNTRIYDPATNLKRTDSIISNPYRFTARRWDNESSLYYYRARMYDPKLGRFLQVDPVGYDAGDMNLYRYCGNDPLNSVDPLGLIALEEKEGIPWWVWAMLVGAAIEPSWFGEAIAWPIAAKYITATTIVYLGAQAINYAANNRTRPRVGPKPGSREKIKRQEQKDKAKNAPKLEPPDKNPPPEISTHDTNSKAYKIFKALEHAASKINNVY